MFRQASSNHALRKTGGVFRSTGDAIHALSKMFEPLQRLGLWRADVAFF
jgi:hypothetical protein